VGANGNGSGGTTDAEGGAEEEAVVWWAIDTPGMCDDEREPESLLVEIERCVEIAPDGIDAFVLVFSAAVGAVQIVQSS
jgi:hypothetical protein